MAAATGIMHYKHLFFDLDHTLWDFETNSRDTLHEVFHAHDLHQTLTPDFDGFYQRYSYHNKRLWDRYNHGFIKQEELRWKRMWHTLLEYKSGDEKLALQLSQEYLKILPHKTQLFPYTIEIIEYLTRKGYALHLITNGFEDVQWGKLRNSQIDHYFGEVITSERAMALKPHKEIFEFALQQTGAQKAESIMIGDNLDADIRGAMQAGLDTVFVNHIGESTELQPTYTIYHLQELETIF
ncbi:MAG: YjjG family noncanonical pyrimidine nucleotidase [Chitinophagaceae bacterium]|nr:YjjG family noncanonical pyrimidine nucleotidase [Chitinophagaceae bacterium]